MLAKAVAVAGVEISTGRRVHKLCITLLLCALGLGQYLQIGLHLHFHFDPRRRRRRTELPQLDFCYELELLLLLLVVLLPLLNLNPEVSAAGAENTRKVGEREMFALPRLRLFCPLPLPAALLVSLDTPEWKGRERGCRGGGGTDSRLG